jgi:hypothetical protein
MEGEGSHDVQGLIDEIDLDSKSRSLLSYDGIIHIQKWIDRESERKFRLL